MEPRSSGATPQKQDTDLQTEFNLLQRKLVPLWEQIGRSDPGGPVELENTTVVIPSMSIEVDLSSSELQAYEQLYLFLLFLLQQPLKRIIYVTSQPVQQAITDYYLETLPGIIMSSARKRLFMICVEDSSADPLSQKLLDIQVLDHIIVGGRGYTSLKERGLGFD